MGRYGQGVCKAIHFDEVAAAVAEIGAVDHSAPETVEPVAVKGSLGHLKLLGPDGQRNSVAQPSAIASQSGS